MFGPPGASAARSPGWYPGRDTYQDRLTLPWPIKPAQNHLLINLEGITFTCHGSFFRSLFTFHHWLVADVWFLCRLIP